MLTSHLSPAVVCLYALSPRKCLKSPCKQSSGKKNAAPRRIRAPVARNRWLKNTAHPPATRQRECSTTAVPPSGRPVASAFRHMRNRLHYTAASPAGQEECPGARGVRRAGCQSVLRVLRRSRAEPVSVFHASGSQQGCAAGSDVLAVREYKAKHPAHPRGSSGITYRGCSLSYGMVVGRTRVDGPFALFFLCVRTPTIHSLCLCCRTLAAGRRPGRFAAGPVCPRSHLRPIGTSPVRRCP